MFCRIIVIAVAACLKYVRVAVEVSLSWRETISDLLTLCWSLWAEADRQARKKAEEEECLYRYRTKTHQITESEEKIERGQLEFLFPSYDEEFSAKNADGDVEMRTEGGTKAVMDESDQHSTELNYSQFSREEMEMMCALHLTVHSKSRTHFTYSPSTNTISSSYDVASQLSQLLQCLPGVLLYVDHRVSVFQYMKSISPVM